MATDRQATEQKLGDLAGSSTARRLANPLGIGGSSVSRFLANPLGIGGGRGPTEVQYGINVPIDGKMSPEKRARLDEAIRQGKMQEATDRVNSVFDDPRRALDLQDFINAIRENFRLDADRQKSTADRRLKFSMARSGLTGGSASADANRTLGEEYTRGLLNAENRAQEAQGDLRGQDEDSRLGIISMVRQGLDATTAASRAGAAMRSNVQAASGKALSEGLGDMFGSTAGIYKQQEEAAERRRGERAAYGSVWGSRG
jgi:hypothetical protein